VTVYIEYAIVDNLFIDWLLLTCSARLVRERYSRLGIAIAVVIGTAFAVVFPLFSLGRVVSLILKLLVGALMAALAVRFKSFKKYLLYLAVFLLLTFASGGALFAVNFLLGYGMSVTDNSFILFGSNDYSIGLIGVSVTIVIKIFTFTFSRVRRRSDVASFNREVALFDGQHSIKITGFIDTGNSLYDPRTGKPVSIISKGLADRCVLNGTLVMRNAHCIECATIHGSKKILVFEIDRIVIYCGQDRNIIDNAIIGISPSDISGSAEIILHPGLLGEQC